MLGDKGTEGTTERGWWLVEPGSNRLALGVVLHLMEGYWTVARTLIGSPAEKAELMKGQQLLSVDEYELRPGKGEPYELQVLMQIEPERAHTVVIGTKSGQKRQTIKKLSLRGLLAFDFDHGGAALGYCRGCRSCRWLTIGAIGCSSGCPGDPCTIA